MNKVNPSEVKKAYRDVRAHMQNAIAYLGTGDHAKAYAEAEKAQHAAFEAKQLIQKGGRYSGT